MAAPEGREGRLVDVGTGILRHDHVLVQHGPAAVVVLGTGPRAEWLRRFANCERAEDDDPFNARCHEVAEAVERGQVAKARRNGIPRAILKMQDRTLRRLAIAEELAKTDFDPDEPRDERGRWTSEGGGDTVVPPQLMEGRSVAAGAVALDAEAAADFAESMTWRGTWGFAGQLSATTRLGLGLLAESFVAPTVFFGTIFIPTNSDLRRQGAVPGRPDIGYEFDEDTGTLKLMRDGALFFVGQNQGGTFRDNKGRVFGQDVGGNVILDPEFLPPAMPGGRLPTIVVTKPEEPKVCPEPVPEDIKGRSARTIAYQFQITQLPPGLAIELIDPVTGKPLQFDGCCTPDNPHCVRNGVILHVLLEAKGEGFENKMVDADNWKAWFKKLDEIKDQMRKQDRTAAAAGWQVEWNYAEKGPADYFARFAKDENLSSTIVRYTPLRRP